MTTNLIFACIYVVSGVATYAYFKAALSSNGIFNDIKPDWFDVIVVFCPLFNTAVVFAWFVEWPYKKKKTKTKYNTRLKNFPNKFFNINNKSHD